MSNLKCRRFPFFGWWKCPLVPSAKLNSRAWKKHDVRSSYHSAQQGKYYTNRFYMKKCRGCAASNNLSVTHCTHCMSHLGDDTIRLRTVDPLCKTANARKVEVDVKELEYIVLYRCFDFSVMLHPQPVSALHLTAVPNGTFYDIKNLRKNHIPMLNKMKAQCESILRDIFTETNVPFFLSNSEHVVHLQKHVKGTRGTSKTSTVNTILEYAIYGFNYPSSYSHVEMHVVVPPVRSCSIFKSPFFYPLTKVLSDLDHLSQVKSYTPEEAKQLYEKDIILEDIMDIDRSFREAYNL